MHRVKIFYDSEFTGLHRDTTLISLALVSEDGARLYAEFTDYDRDQVVDFVREHVLAHTLWLGDDTPPANRSENDERRQLTTCVGDRKFIAGEVADWLARIGEVQIWADHVSYDWVLFCDLFGGALSLPGNIHYIPMDLCTWLECHGYNADCNREEFAQSFLVTQNSGSGDIASAQHNALFDAEVSLACYRRGLAEIETGAVA